jgi:hypothetical protein
MTSDHVPPIPVLIYVRLLNEGIDAVYRPTTAERLENGLFRLNSTPDYNPEDEEWEFLPGTTVAGRMEDLYEGRVLVAIRIS